MELDFHKIKFQKIKFQKSSWLLNISQTVVDPRIFFQIVVYGYFGKANHAYFS